MLKLLALLNVLNVADAVSTHVALSMKIATEENPFMAFLYDIHPALFFIIKMSLLAFASYLVIKLYKVWPDRTMKLLSALNIMYTILLLWHAYCWGCYFLS